MADNSRSRDFEGNNVRQLGGVAFSVEELERLKSMIIVLISQHSLVQELQNNPEVAVLFRSAMVQLQQQISDEEKKKKIPSAKENPFWQYLLNNGFAERTFNQNPDIKAKLVNTWITTMAQQPHGIQLSPELQRGAQKNARGLFKSRRSRLRGLILNAVWDNPQWGDATEETTVERSQLKEYFDTAAGKRQLKDWILFNVLHIVVDYSDSNDDKISAHLLGFVRATMVSCAGHVSKDSAKKSFSELAKVEDKQDLDSELEEEPRTRPALHPIATLRQPPTVTAKQPTPARPKVPNRSQQESQARSIAHQIASASNSVSREDMWERFAAVEQQSTAMTVSDDEEVSSAVITLSTRRYSTSSNKENVPEVTTEMIAAANRANRSRKTTVTPSDEQAPATPSRPQRACTSRKRKADEDSSKQTPSRSSKTQRTK